jgi:hypothetical protein
MPPAWMIRTVTAALVVSLSGAPALAAGQAQASSVPAAQSAAQSTPPPTTKPPSTTGPSEQELARIREAVSKPPSITIDNGRLRIYMEVIAKWPSFSDMAKGYDLMNGPTKGGNPMTHAEFLSMVTPKDMIGSAGIQPTEILQFAIVNWLGQAIIKKGLEEIRNAHSQREIAEIRARIDRELAALKSGGEK